MSATRRQQQAARHARAQRRARACADQRAGRVAVFWPDGTMTYETPEGAVAIVWGWPYASNSR